MDETLDTGRSGENLNRSKLREQQFARLREIETAAGRSGIGKKGHTLKPTDRILAARAIGRLVRKAREQGFSVEQIRDSLRASGTDRLDRYRLDPNVDDAGARERVNKLSGKVNGYLAVASAVAKMLGSEPEELKVEVLLSTSLFSRPSGAQADEDTRASNLAMELAKMGRAVARCTVSMQCSNAHGGFQADGMLWPIA